MSVGNERGVVDALKFDLKQMHETWMEVVWPRQRSAEGTVLGKWRPDGGLTLFLYRLWSVVGVPVVALAYPLVLFGYFIRFQTKRINSTAVSIGFAGVVGLFVVLWGALSLLAKFQFSASLDAGGVTAVAAASGVAIVSSALAYGFWVLGGRFTTVLLAYPFAMTAIFLPPVVAALYAPAVAGVVLDQSDSLARWFLFDAPSIFGVQEFLVENFTREGFAYVLMWFGISVPLGWLLGLVVTLAELVRPTPE
ncbi:hypothetical protein [Salinibaculum rarum]|uniref:hypothetical protein n=1 Tax=Salinibaculum rarum TaxID=3058903 RepID=UPI00265F670C|nr:hypothetical protein [Salinibaculum sp. KK48]